MRLEEYLNSGFKIISKTIDGQWFILQNEEGGLIYDMQRNKIIKSYRIEVMRRKKYSA